MSKDYFPEIVELVLGHEGGYTANPQDRGNWTSGVIGVGELRGTKYGISAMSYPNVDIKNLTLEQARALYRRDFWDALGCGAMTPALALAVFDCAVNMGVGRAREFLKQTTDPEDFMALRLRFYPEIRTFDVFGRGWVRRVAALMQQVDAYQDAEVQPAPAGQPGVVKVLDRSGAWRLVRGARAEVELSRDLVLVVNATDPDNVFVRLK